MEHRIEPSEPELSDGTMTSGIDVGPALDWYQLGTTSHRAVGIQDLADDTGRFQASEPSQIYRCFSLSDSAQYAARLSTQREDVARAP